MSAKAEESTSSRDPSLTAIVTGMRVVRWIVLVIVAILLMAQLLSRFEGAYRYPLVKSVYYARSVIMSTLGAGVKNSIPTYIGGRDRSD